MITLDVLHSQEFRYPILKFPIPGEGYEQWLGDGYYFWEDLEFAKWWGKTHKINNTHKKYSVFCTQLTFEEDDFIDTVFNEQDYKNFVCKIEKFANKYYAEFGEKPTLEEFNDFVEDYNLWSDIKVIRFQDISNNVSLLKVRGYYYKKRIQIRVIDPQIITNFAHYKSFS